MTFGRELRDGPLLRGRLGGRVEEGIGAVGVAGQVFGLRRQAIAAVVHLHGPSTARLLLRRRLPSAGHLRGAHAWPVTTSRTSGRSTRATSLSMAMSTITSALAPSSRYPHLPHTYLLMLLNIHKVKGFDTT